MTNNPDQDYGGGAKASTLNNCVLEGNSGPNGGGGVYGGTLNNCTLIGNFTTLPSTYGGGGALSATLNNCILYYNTNLSGSGSGLNYDASAVLNYCCTMPMPTNGVGNITNAPQLSSISHLSEGSPCIGRANSAYTTGTDIDG